MSQFIKFYLISFMLNMFRTLIHSSSGACDFSILSPQWLCINVSMCVGVSVWLSWGGIHVAGWSTTCASACYTDTTPTQLLSLSSHSQHLKISFYFSFHRFLGLPLLLNPCSSWVKIFMGILSFSVLSRWPNQFILCLFTNCCNIIYFKNPVSYTQSARSPGA